MYQHVRLSRGPAPRWVLLGALTFAIQACSDDTYERPQRGGPRPDSGNDSGLEVGSDVREDVQSADDSGAVSVPDGSSSFDSLRAWNTLCAGCHGDEGQGGIGPELAGTTRTFEELRDAIDVRMPPEDPTLCVGECAEGLAQFILELSDAGAAVDCSEGSPPAVRRLRLLTRREYNNTIADLFAEPATLCEVSGDCDWQSEQCNSGRCIPNPCGEVVFAWNPNGRTVRSVHVAGAFNGWPGTLAAGGLRMSWRSDIGRWVARARLIDGENQYKFVINESEWIADPEAAEYVSDGFGGQNAVARVECQTSGGDNGSSFHQDWVATVPAEVRPQGFFYDTSASATLVTPTHAEEYLDAAERLGRLVASDLGRLAPCAWESNRSACMTAFVEEWAPRIYRRAISESERQRLIDFGLAGDPGQRADVQWLVTAMLSSPHFLYRSEMGEDIGDGVWRLTPYETASLLSYTYTASMPDAELLAAAAANALQTPEQIAAQVQRLLDDPRARDVIGTFAEQWLGIERILTTPRNEAMFPNFNDEVRSAMRDETRAFVTHVFFDSSGRFAELYGADYTFANAVLAPLYDLTGVTGTTLQQVPYNGNGRSGVLGHGSVLVSTAHSDQTSPIRRGLFVRERLLCQEFPVPPANAGGVPDVDPNATTRERFRQHTDDPTCFACHQYIDDLGFGFEQFDAIGATRATENGLPVDSTGIISDIEGFGTSTSATFTNLTQLAAALEDSRQARQCMVRQYYRFARGYHEEREDLCTIEQIDDAFLRSGGDLRTMMIAVATEPGFLLRREEAP